jgi:hypothetical protein
VFVLDDFRRATLYKDGREEQVALKSAGQRPAGTGASVCASVLQGGAAPISLDELAATSRATFRVLDSLRERHPSRFKPQIQGHKDRNLFRVICGGLCVELRELSVSTGTIDAPMLASVEHRGPR